MTPQEATRARTLSTGATIAPVIFIAGWSAAGAFQDAAYSSARHDVSDLGALTARYPWIMLISQGLAGLITILFAILALRPALRSPGHRDALSAWLVACSLMGLDNLGDAFFRLDCRTADVGCTQAAQAASWHGTMHVAIAFVAVFVTVAAPFALARRMRLLDEWRDLAPKAVWFGVVFLLVLVLYVLQEGRLYAGYTQRAMTVLLAIGLIVLARRVRFIVGRAADTVGAPAIA